MTTADGPALARRLGTGDAVVVGLGAMLGAGVFVAFTPAAEAAGRGLLLGLGIAAVRLHLLPVHDQLGAAQQFLHQLAHARHALLVLELLVGQDAPD